jgi:hypothetical protein
MLAGKEMISFHFRENRSPLEKSKRAHFDALARLRVGRGSGIFE